MNSDEKEAIRELNDAIDDLYAAANLLVKNRPALAGFIAEIAANVTSVRMQVEQQQS